ncbi:DNA polymerase delta, subunit 4 [Phlyctochytrium arcticum]|nr:DNA polymerase delta, subunit 4 [Phlyctochytrium arcticum]
MSSRGSTLKKPRGSGITKKRQQRRVTDFNRQSKTSVVKDKQLLEKQSPEDDFQIIPSTTQISSPSSKEDKEAELKALKELPTHLQSVLSDKELLVDTLKSFDLDYKFGPCVGLTRLERWKRAEMLDLDPPKDIYLLLTTPQATHDDALREALWHKEL